MSKTEMTYTTEIEHQIVYEASVAEDTINFETPSSEYDWAANILYDADWQMIAQSLAYGELEIADYAAAAEWLRSTQPGLEVEADEVAEIRGLMHRALPSPDSDYDRLSKAAKVSAIAEMLGDDGEWDGYYKDGDRGFANEYDLILVPRGEECRTEDAVKLSPEDWAAAWGRYPDAITMSAVSLFVQANRSLPR